MNTFFEISNSDDFIRVETLEFVKYNSDLDWDKNWVKSKITLKIGVFSGEYNADFMTVDFNRFKEQLLVLYNQLNGGAMFYDLDNHLAIKITGDGNGHLTVNIKASDEPGYGGELSFNLYIDQTYIMPLVKHLNNITEAFPIIGKLK